MASRYTRSFLFKAKMVGGALNTLSYLAPKIAGELCFKIFCRPRKRVINSQQTSFLATARYRDFVFGNEKVALFHWPNIGPSVLLLHGWESQSGRWMNLIKMLQNAGFSVVAFDAPAHGNSGFKYFNPKLYGDIALAVTREYQPEFFVGHSIGGASLCYLLSQCNSESVQAAVLMATPASHDCIYGRYAKILGLRPSMKNLLESAIKRNLGVDPRDFDCRLFAAKIHCEVLNVYDLNDEIVPAGESIAIANSFQKSKSLVFEDVGHRMKHEKVIRQIANYITNFK